VTQKFIGGKKIAAENLIFGSIISAAIAFCRRKLRGLAVGR
jgi:hypothetical protein